MLRSILTSSLFIALALGAAIPEIAARHDDAIAERATNDVLVGYGSGVGAKGSVVDKVAADVLVGYGSGGRVAAEADVLVGYGSGGKVASEADVLVGYGSGGVGNKVAADVLVGYGGGGKVGVANVVKD